MRKLLLSLLILFISSPAYATWPVNWSWDSIGGGWGCIERPIGAGYGSGPNCTDYTPEGSCSLKIVFPAGMEDGGEPYHCWNGLSAPRSEIWIQFYFKFSSNWTEHGVIDKLIYINYGDPLQSDGDILANNGGNLQFRQQHASLRGEYGNKINPTIVYGDWYLVKIRLVVNTAGSSNGILQIWVNGAKTHDFSDYKFIRDNENGWGFREVTITPVWGGVGGSTKPNEEYLWIDHTIIQGTNPGGGVPTDTTPPTVSNHSPAKGEANVRISDRTISVNMTDTDDSFNSGNVDSSTIVITVQGTQYTCSSSQVSCIGGDPAAESIVYTNDTDWSTSTVITWSVDGSDITGNAMSTDTSTFTTSADSTGEEVPARSLVLSYLQGLSAKTTKKVLSGQYIDTSYSTDTTLFNDIFAIASEYPAVMGGDYVDKANHTTDYTTYHQNFIDHWDAGGLVTMSWHIDNPTTGTFTWSDPALDVNLVNVITPGDPEYVDFIAELDRVAGALQQLEDAGVVVLWRPFHEMNGNWFWWGNKPGSDFQNMWRFMHDYFTNTKGLGNLIWVFSVNRDWGGVSTYYPGDAYVDIVGIDYYEPSGIVDNPPEYAQLIALGKPFAITELGQCNPAWGTVPCSTKDTGLIISGIKSEMPNAVYWMNWNEVFSLDQHNNLATTLADHWVVNRDDVDLGVSGPVAPPTDFELHIHRD